MPSGSHFTPPIERSVPSHTLHFLAPGSFFSVYSRFSMLHFVQFGAPLRAENLPGSH